MILVPDTLESHSRALKMWI